MRKDSGLTIVDLVTALAVVAILAVTAGPGVNRWLQNYKLKRAARDLYSNIQLAKLGAIRANATWAVVFDGTGYTVRSDNGADASWLTTDDVLRQEARFGEYGRDVGYGYGNADQDVGGNTVTGSEDPTVYNSDMLLFNARGLCNAGYVYLENNQGRPASERYAYAVGTRANGNVVLRKWYPGGTGGGSWGGALGR